MSGPSIQGGAFRIPHVKVILRHVPVADLKTPVQMGVPSVLVEGVELATVGPVLLGTTDSELQVVTVTIPMSELVVEDPRTDEDRAKWHAAHAACPPDRGCHEPEGGA